MNSHIKPGQGVVALALPLPIDGLNIAVDFVERVYGTGETMLKPQGDTIQILAPAAGFGPVKRSRGKLPRSAKSEMDITHQELTDGTLKLTLEDHQNAVLVLAEMMKKWFDLVGGINYVEVTLQTPERPADYIFTMQRIAGETPHNLRLKAEQERDAALTALAEATA